MNVLLIHSEDDPERGPWSDLRWDRVVDLGLGGANSYARWGERFRCPVSTLDSLRTGFRDFYKIRELMDLGCGRLTDAYGLDWWELISIMVPEELERLVLLMRFARSLSPGQEVWVSRPGLHANILQCLLPGRVRVFPWGRRAKRSGLGHYVRVANKFSSAQLIEIFWDKYDSGHQFRGRFAAERPPSDRPVVLLPTAYVNVSRTGIAYANTFPELNFLLVATRQSGWLNDLPRNVTAARISSYASLGDRPAENLDLENRWRSLLEELKSVEEFELFSRLGCLDNFPRYFRHGIEVRDAWRNVLDREPVQSVLCGDDSNPYTRIPLLLAQKRGMSNISCHHGALDGRFVFKRCYADTIWARGKMEEDYLVRKCGVPREKVEICAPSLPETWRGTEREKYDSSGRHILFISEVYEVSGGRTEEFYRDVLPPLAELGLATGRELIVKLHPGENQRERTALVDRVLSAKQRRAARVVSGPLTEDLFRSAWFGITVLSTVAMECAVRGIPCFLCKWFECWSYGYVDQFIRFEIGMGLNHPSEIANIPELLSRYAGNPNVAANCWEPAGPRHLRELSGASRNAFAEAAR